ncbi:hypothetical protein QO002_004287 [Pararhizobium capsulatum DSM 1112]|uniref:Uncharacterized protein n=1 Tax=Pararhizobium capsulatum DSM 1112 TaxID=1121113 RepID=A0ABU0BV09_9HYPH|nr:hypothetical protein [Pararhizobium capsulatum DSM 1112]
MLSLLVRHTAPWQVVEAAGLPIEGLFDDGAEGIHDVRP